MPAAATATPRAERFLRDKLVPAMSPLLVFNRYAPRYVPGTTTLLGKHVRYSWQGASDVVYIGGARFVRTAWLVYVAQSTETSSTGTLFAADLQDDADRLNDALDFAPVVTVGGRRIDGCKRDNEHYYPVWLENVLVELQLGAYYIVYSSVAS